MWLFRVCGLLLWSTDALAQGAVGSDVRWIHTQAEHLPAVLRERVFEVALWQYLALVLLFGLALVVRALVKVIIGRRLRALTQALGQAWASSLVESMSAPLATLVMAVLLRAATPLLLLPDFASSAINSGIRVLMALAAVVAGYRLVDLVSTRMAERAAKTESKLDDQLVPLVRKALKTLVTLGGGLFILQNLHVNIGSLLAGLGIGGLAFAFAAKETLSNFFGSVMIFIDRPFQIGDWIVVKGAEGIVEEVGFRSTRIRTFYNSVIAMPNAVFNDAQVDNFGKREYRRTVTTLNLTYDTTPSQVQAFCEGIRSIILANDYTRKDYYEVHMSGFGAHSLDVMVYFFFKVSSWSDELRERHNVFLEIMRLAERMSVSFAFPTQTLNIENLAEPMPSQERVYPAESELAHVVTAFGPGGGQSRPRGPRIVEGAMLPAPSASGQDQDEG